MPTQQLQPCSGREWRSWLLVPAETAQRLMWSMRAVHFRMHLSQRHLRQREGTHSPLRRRGWRPHISSTHEARHLRHGTAVISSPALSTLPSSLMHPRAPIAQLLLPLPLEASCMGRTVRCRRPGLLQALTVRMGRLRPQQLRLLHRRPHQRDLLDLRRLLARLPLLPLSMSGRCRGCVARVRCALQLVLLVVVSRLLLSCQLTQTLLALLTSHLHQTCSPTCSGLKWLPACVRQSLAGEYGRSFAHASTGR